MDHELRKRGTSVDGRTPDSAGPPAKTSDLGVRAASALVLGPVAIVAAWLGGLPFLLLCAFASVGIWWEWAGLCGGPGRQVLVTVGAVSLGLAAIALAFGWVAVAIACLVIGAVVVAVG